MKNVQEYFRGNWLKLSAVFAVMLAYSAGLIDPAAAALGGMVVLDTETPTLKGLEKAMKEAFDAMSSKVKQVQEIADNALAESKKLGGTMEAKTNEKLTEVSTASMEAAKVAKEARDKVLELAQKIGTRPGGDSEVQQSIGEIIVASDEYKVAASHGRMAPVVIKSFHGYGGRKTQIVNATLDSNQPLVAPQRVPGIITPAEQRLYMRDIIPSARASSNLIQYASEATFTNNARPQGDASPGGIEGEQFAESAMTFSLANAPLVTLGHWIPASRQVLNDAAMLQGHVSERLTYGLKLVEDQEYLTGDGTAGKINGINNQATAFNGGATNQTILDTLLKALLQVSLSNYDADAYVLHPTDWYAAMMLKDTLGRYLFSDPQSMVQPRVWAKPVVPSQSQTVGTFTCGAFQLGAQIWDLEDATVRISENVNDHFIRNMVAILAEERTTLCVYRTPAFIKGSVSYAG